MPDDEHTSPRLSPSNPTHKATVARWIAVAAWAALIFGMSSLPGSRVPGNFGTQAHFTEYAILAALLYAALRSHTGMRSALVWAIVLASGYGVTDELHQSFVPLRVPDVMDWAVDSLGAVVGAAMATFGERFVRLRRRKPQ